MATTEENKDEKKEAIKRTKRLEARVTEKEYAKVVELAETCGLTLSDYIRKCALRQHPRRRLTDKEVEALCSLSDARGELIRIAAAVKSIQGRLSGAILRRHPFRGAVDACRRSPYSPLE